MVDTAVLAWLSNGMTVDGVEYFVTWDCQRNCAIITYPYSTDEVQKLAELYAEDGAELTFRCELDAHRYLVDMKRKGSDGRQDVGV
jgi:hypothetical protein